MAKSIASINSLLVNIKTANNPLLITLQQQGFDIQASLGSEQEYSVKTLINAINNLAIQLLTVTADREQFIQRTSFVERIEIESCLKGILTCLQQTTQTLSEIHSTDYQCDDKQTLFYDLADGSRGYLKLLDAVHFIELIKPYFRILENITTQKRIHALSSILETVLSKAELAEAEKGNEINLQPEQALKFSQ